MKILTLLVLVLSVCTTLAFATDLGGYIFLRIASSDARAIVRTPEGVKQLVAPGSMLGDATITMIDQNRVMLERPSELGLEVLIVRLLNGMQKIDRVQKGPVKQKAIYSDSEKMSVQMGS